MKGPLTNTVRPAWMVEDAPPPTSRGRRAREDIVKAASELFQERAYGTVAVADIAEASGLSVGSFYRYFANKEDLLIFLLSQMFWDMYSASKGAWETDRPPLGNFELTTVRYLQSYWEHRALLRCAFQVVAVSDRVRDMWHAVRRDLYDHMLVRLRQDQASSPLMPLDPVITVRSLAGMVEEYARRAFVDEEFGPADEELVGAMSSVLARIWYRALFVEDRAEGMRVSSPAGEGRSW